MVEWVYNFYILICKEMFFVRRLLACLLCALMMVSVLIGVATTANAASLQYYNSYNGIALIKNRGKCSSMQGMAVGSTYIYTVKIKTDNTKAFISKTNKNTGETTVLTETATGSTYINYLGHANDMDVCSLDGKSNLFIATMETGKYSLVRMQVSGSKITKKGNYTLKLNGEKTSVSGVSILSKSGTKVKLLLKKGCTFYTATVDTAKSSGTVKLTKAFKINVSDVTVNGKSMDLSSWVHQGYGYEAGKIYVPLTGPDGKKNVSIIAVYDIDGATGTIKADPNLSFRITSKSYADLFEIESCGISSDGKLYFNTNRRKTSSDSNHDGIHCFKEFSIK